ncbi:tripartite motif-containing protein 66-like [Entelurus aequoreus]|uniref:tripartite motif-containing protein 66-like n=1 Tax=Entelurus aequoreus TaxID=161455 RepID=UPI002B1D5D4E|nr:tripartite motif-containing protein 66-like [Entelurus aequoreus]XP_061898823.1 tripartite motif-containing protein 66-like [Entelurus aequoreus]
METADPPYPRHGNLPSGQPKKYCKVSIEADSSETAPNVANKDVRRVLGSSRKAVVRLERLDFRTLSGASLGQVGTLNEVNPNGSAKAEIQEKRPDLSPSGSPASAPELEPDPDPPYVMVHQHGKADLDTFYLDPDRKLIMVLELEPEDSECEPAPESKCGDPHGDSSTQEVVQSGGGSEEMESEDYCAVCRSGGDLLCCDFCPKVYHLACHIPSLLSLPTGDWACSLCMTDHDPAEAFVSEGVSTLYALSPCDQRKCEKLTLLLYVHTLSDPFHEPVSRQARNYYQVIKRPVDLSLIRRKLDRSNTVHYFTADQFVNDVLLMFSNCATFNYPDSEVARAGRHLEVFFLSQLKEIFPDRTFPSASRDRTERARLQWRSRRRKEAGRRERNERSGWRKDFLL